MKNKYLLFTVSKTSGSVPEWVGRSVSGMSRVRGLWSLARNGKCKRAFCDWANTLPEKFFMNVWGFPTEEALFKEYERVSNFLPTVENPQARIENIKKARQVSYLQKRSRVLDFLEKNPNASAIHIATYAGIKPESVKTSIKSLQKQGFLAWYDLTKLRTWYNPDYGNSIQESTLSIEAASHQRT